MCESSVLWVGMETITQQIDSVYLPSPLLSQIVNPDIHPPYISSTASQAQVEIWKRTIWALDLVMIMVMNCCSLFNRFRTCTKYFTCIISFNSHKTPLGYTEHRRELRCKEIKWFGQDLTARRRHAHGQTDWYRILPPPPALISPRAVSQGNYRGGFRFPADWTTQNFSSHKFLKG